MTEREEGKERTVPSDSGDERRRRRRSKSLGDDGNAEVACKLDVRSWTKNAGIVNENLNHRGRKLRRISRVFRNEKDLFVYRASSNGNWSNRLDIEIDRKFVANNSSTVTDGAGPTAIEFHAWSFREAIGKLTTSFFIERIGSAYPAFRWIILRTTSALWLETWI